VAMTGLLLLGMTPVIWLFSVSTNNLSFIVIINLVSWIVAVGFALRFFGMFGQPGINDKISGLKWWLFIYIMVSLQMATTMRPLLGKPGTGLEPVEKKFFLAHFKDTLAESGKSVATGNQGKRR